MEVDRQAGALALQVEAGVHATNKASGSACPTGGGRCARAMITLPKGKRERLPYSVASGVARRHFAVLPGRVPFAGRGSVQVSAA